MSLEYMLGSMHTLKIYILVESLGAAILWQYKHSWNSPLIPLSVGITIPEGEDREIKMPRMEYKPFQCLGREKNSDLEPLSSIQPFSFFSQQFKAWYGRAQPILATASQTSTGASSCTCKFGHRGQSPF